MSVDDADTLRRFISQIYGQNDYVSPRTVTSPPGAQNEQPANEHGPTLATTSKQYIDEFDPSEGAKTPSHVTVAGQGHSHLLTSPEAHPQPSPHVSGLKPPYNTPRTAASSPRPVAANTHNEDVAEAFSDYVNTLDTRSLSESMWAPPSARYKPSMLSGARSTKVLIPVKAVEPNPAINATFDRMSFKAADRDFKMGENLIGDRVTRSLFARAPPAFLAEKLPGVIADNVVQAKLERVSGDDIEPASHSTMVEEDQKDQGTQPKSNGTGKDDLPKTTHTDRVGKENEAPSTPKAHVPPHLRTTRVSNQKPVKAEMNPPSFEPLGSVVTGKTTESGVVKDAVRAATKGIEPKVTTGLAGTKPLTEASSAGKDLEHKTFFTTWPKLEERNRPAAKVRKVIIKDLPRGSTASIVASLVYGGPIEEIQVRSSTAGNLSAMVRFMDAGDCMKFYNETSNGLVYKKDEKGRELVLCVELSKDVNVVGGLLQGWITSGVTRCVRAVGVGPDWDMNGLLKMAERKNRKVEKIVDGQSAGGARSVVFRFCKVEDAVQFKGALCRDEEFEQCNIHYAADPCAIASGVHLES